MQLMAVIIPSLERMQKEDGEAGRRKLQQIIRVFTVFLALFQSIIFALALYKLPSAIMPAIVALTAGAVIVMWLGELISEKGLGNGPSILIFIGIIAGIPLYCNRTAILVSQDPVLQLGLLLLIAIFLATIVFIIILHEAERRVPIVSARRQVGNKVYGGQNTHIPFKLNPGGVMPIIFAIAILLFPATVLGFVQEMHIENVMVAGIFERLNLLFSANSISYYVIYFVLIVTLTFFYASIIPSMQPKEIANNLKKYGSAIPGVKPGKPTSEKLNEILTRITLIGALALGIVAMVPTVATKVTNITTLQGIGATSLIILVGVALDIVNRIKTQMLAKNYESFLQQ